MQKKVKSIFMVTIFSLILSAGINLKTPLVAQEGGPTIVCKCKLGQCVADGMTGNQCNATNLCADWSSNCFQPPQQ